jgi:two-component sensor histidine kinase/streptogramin lyase
MFLSYFSTNIQLFICLLSALLAWVELSFAQPAIKLKQSVNEYSIATRNYSTRDGLSHSQVRCVFQDSKGFLWIGTDQGLNRFDGYEFKTFQNFENNQILGIIEGAGGLLRTVNGRNNIELFDPTKFESTGTEIKCRLDNSTYSEILIDKNDFLWLINRNSLYKIVSGKLHPVLKMSYPNSQFGLRCNVIRLGPNEDIWIGTLENVWVQCSGNGKLKKYYLLADPIVKSIPPLTDELIDRPGTWEYHLEKFENGTVPFQKVDLDQLNVLLNDEVSQPFVILSAWGHNVVGPDWVATSEHFGSKFEIFDPRANNKLVLSDSGSITIREIPHIDQSGIIWAGNNSGGLKQVKIKRQPFKKLLHNIEPEWKIHDKISCRGMLENENGKIYIGTYDGVFCASQDLNEIERWEPNNAFFDGKSALPGMVEMVADSNGNIWMTNDSRGILKYDVQTNSIVPMKIGVNDAEFGTAAFKDRSGTIWLSVEKQIFRVDENQQLVHFPLVFEGHTLPNIYVHDIFQSNYGFIWIATKSGIFQVDEQGNIIRVLTSNDNKSFDDLIFNQDKSSHPRIASAKIERNLASNEVYCIYQDSTDIFWFGTAKGLHRYDPQSKSIQLFTEADGLSNNSVCGILPENNQNIWLASFNGLMRFNTQTNNVRAFYEQDGLVHYEFNRHSFFKDSRDRLWFGGIGGVTIVDPGEFIDEPQSNALMFTSKFEQYDGTTGALTDMTEDLIHTGEIKLNHNDRYFILHFGLADYNHPEENEFSYKIEGLDDDWTYIGKQHSLRINNLKPGDYNLLIRGRPRDGYWSVKPLQISIFQRRAFFKTWWFISGYVVLGSLIMFLIISVKFKFDKRRIQLDDEHQRREMSEVSLKEKDVLLKEIHHRVKNNLQLVSSLINLQAGVIKNETTAAALMEGRSRVKAIALVHQKLYQSHDIAFLSMQEYLEELTLFLESAMKQTGVNVEKDIIANHIQLDIDTAVPIGLITNELITNIYKYAFVGRQSGKISIMLKKNQPHNFELTIKDNGIGMPQNFNIQSVSSLGLRLVNNLTSQIDGNFKIDYDDSGTTFVIKFTDSKLRTQTT